MERITATTYAAGVNHQQVTIAETYGEAAAYSYAAGKPKFNQFVNGVQTWYDYEATTEHGATHKQTVTTKANGELVAAQSRKKESFIAADDTTTFEQEFIWDGKTSRLLSTPIDTSFSLCPNTHNTIQLRKHSKLRLSPESTQNRAFF